MQFFDFLCRGKNDKLKHETQSGNRKWGNTHVKIGIGMEWHGIEGEKQIHEEFFGFMNMHNKP